MEVMINVVQGIAYPYPVVFLTAGRLTGQEDELDRLLNEEVENINPVYKPVVGFGVGVLNYFGDIKNNYYSPTLGTLGYKVNLSTYIDDSRYFKAEFFFMGGNLSGNERSYANPDKNFNFETTIYNFGFDCKL